MKYLITFSVKLVFLLFISTHALSNELQTIGLDDAKKYAQDLPKLMMGGKKKKKLIDATCKNEKNVAQMDLLMIRLIKLKSLENVENKCQ